MVELPEQWKWSSYQATAGQGKPHPCLSAAWVLSQFSGKRGKAEQEYRQFVRWGIGQKTIWTDVRGQTILGEEDFTDRLVDYLGKHKDVHEITRSQRYVNRPPLDKLFPENILRSKSKRDRRIADAVENHIYLQREIAAHLGLNYATVSRIASAQEKRSKYKT
jgi:hypothetical protein